MSFPADVVALSLAAAMLCAAVVGIPLGLLLAVYEFRFRRFLIGASTVLLGLPPVIIGLGMFALGRTGLPSPALLTPALALLSLPTVVAIVHRAAASHYRIFRTELRIAGAGGVRRGWMMLVLTRSEIAAAALAALARSTCEFGVVLIAGAAVAPERDAGLLLIGAIVAGGILAGGAAFVLSGRRS